MSRKKVPRLGLQALDGRDVPTAGLTLDVVYAQPVQVQVVVTTPIVQASLSGDQVAAVEPVDSTGNPLPPAPSGGPQTGTTPTPPPPPTGPTRPV
jgi:hypothetical protein